jgi:hypothetical protein
MLIRVISLFLLFYFTFVGNVKASGNSFVTIANPVRISEYNKEHLRSLESEYFVVEKLKLSATWLLSYDSITDGEIVSLVKTFNNDQEKGIFMEITPKLCKETGVTYKNEFSWHHAANIFLTGYTQQERRILIDKVFESFEHKFGYFPESVGAWWIDSYSLTYMKEKYGISVNLGLADQFSTDGYQVWGTYWSTPFYPSRFHAGIPASTSDRSFGVLTLEWAPRDPLNGYYNSLFSTQDYLVAGKNLKTDYFDKLVKTYSLRGNNDFGHLVVGLESDLSEEAYRGEYSHQLEVISNLSKKGEVSVLNMRDFAKWYDSNYHGDTPIHLIESNDLLGSNIKIYWFQTPHYRVGMSFDKNNNLFKVFDFRVYPINFQEPYYYSQNIDFYLKINIPSIIDEITQNNAWIINSGKFVSQKYENNVLSLYFEKGSLLFNNDALSVSGFQIPVYVSQNPYLSLSVSDQTSKLSIKEKLSYDEAGLVFKEIKPEVVSLLRSKKIILVFLAIILSYFYFLFKILSFEVRTKVAILISSFVIFFGLFLLWKDRNSNKYYVSQSEIDALYHLSLLEKGGILVYDNSCLGCSWNSPNKPAVYDNYRNYVARLSGKKIIYNKSIFNAEDRILAKKELDKLGIKYIYVVSLEAYTEKVPFSPGDLGIKLIFENANSQIWEKIK